MVDKTIGLLFFSGIFIWLVGYVIIGAIVVFWALMLADVIKRKFPNENNKIVWMLVVILTGIIGAVIYYFMVKRKSKNQ
jgi:prolipoprotein diacylglyceryltransferase